MSFDVMVLKFAPNYAVEIMYPPVTLVSLITHVFYL